MRLQAKRLILPVAALLLFTGAAFAAERSLDSIRQAWLSNLKGVQVFGVALQELDSDAKACGLERVSLARAVRDGLDQTSLNLTQEDPQLFNFFVEIETLQFSDRCASMASLRVSAFVDPAYPPLLAAEITPWRQRAMVISAKANHPQAIASELAKQAAEFASLWREQQSR